MRGVDIPPFHAGAIGAIAAERLRAGLETVPMHFGQPTLGLPERVLDAARSAMASGPTGYWESHALREAIARRYRDRYGVDIAPERVLLTCGASAGLVAVFTAMLAAGDRVALARPGYPAYRNALEGLGRQAVEIACGPEVGFKLTAERLASVDEPLHGVVVASPGNPTGAVLSRAELAALLAAARERDLLVVSDEIYHGIEYGAEPAASALELDPEAIVVGSFSKLFRMPGWRLGWLIAPADRVPRLHAHLINFFLTPPALSQHAALAALDDVPAFEAAVAGYAANRDRLLEALPALGFERLVAPQGAFYLYADVGRFTRESLAWCRRLVADTGLALAPGIDFDRVDGERFVRFSFAVSAAEVERAIALLRESLGRSG